MTVRSFASLARIDSQLLDRLLELVELVLQLLVLELREAAQLQVEDVVGLDLAEAVALAHQLLARCVGALGGPDEGDDVVDPVDRLEQALDDVRSVLRLLQPVLGAAGDDLDLVVDVHLQRVAQVQQARCTVDQREHVHREVRLHGRVLVELVQHDLRVRVALELDDEADRVTGRLVAHVADALDLAFVHEVGDLGADHLDRGLVRHLTDDDALLALATLVDLGNGAHLDGPAPGPVRVARAGLAEDERAGREVGRLHELHQVVARGLGVVDEVQHRVHDLGEVVWRDVRGHPDRDATAAVDEQVRESRREDLRLLVVAVVGLLEVDGVLVDLAEQLHRERRQLRLGVVIDEPVGEERVVLGVDAHGVHGLHAGVVDRCDLGVVPAAAHERRDHALDLGVPDPVQHLAAPATVPALHRRDVVLLQPLPVVAARATLGPQVLGEERHSIVRARGRRAGKRRDERLELVLLRAPEPDPVSEARRISPVADDHLDLAVLVAALPRDHAELEQEPLHIAGELCAARGVRHLHRVAPRSEQDPSPS